MITFSLQSGSNGNAIYVEADGTGVLFDAGISGRQAMLRLAHHGRDVQCVRHLVISHEHNDHIRCAGIYQRKFGMKLWTTGPTRAACPFVLEERRIVEFKSGQQFQIGSLTIQTIPTPHDGVDSVAFVAEHDGARLGILTDLGHPFDGLAEILSTLDAAYLESNYDPRMLEDGSYPARLKVRIRGRNGHLSNHEAALVVHQVVSDKLRWVALAHLSEQNNTPQVALQTHRHYLGGKLPIHLATRSGPSDLLEVHSA